MKNDIEKVTTNGPPATARIAPFAYWRTFGRPDYGIVRRLQLSCVVGAVFATEDVWKRAVAGDAACSVAIALTMRIPVEVTPPVDVRMSILLNAALAGDAACASVMGNMLMRMPLASPLRERLSSSWLGRGGAS